MKNVFGWASQHIILLILMVFIAVGLLFRQEIIGTDPVPMTVADQGVSEPSQPEVIEDGTSQAGATADDMKPDMMPSTTVAAESVVEETPQTVVSTDPAVETVQQVDVVTENDQDPQSGGQSEQIKNDSEQALVEGQAQPPTNLEQSSDQETAEESSDAMNKDQGLGSPLPAAPANPFIPSIADQPSATPAPNESVGEYPAVPAGEIQPLTPLEEQALTLKYRPAEDDDEEPSVPEVLATRDTYFDDARQAYWNGEEDKAIGIYQALIDYYPEDTDAYGELGNIFLKRGDTQTAFDYYVQVVLLLEQTGKKIQAEAFVKSVSRFDSQLAERLKRQSDVQDR